MTNTDIGAKVHSLRIENELTLDDLADVTGSSKSYIWEIENKPTIRPSAQLVYKLSLALGVTMEYLIGVSHDKEKAIDLRFFDEYMDQPAATRKVIRQIARVVSGP